MTDQDNNFRFIGQGVYSLTEAERLTRIPRKRIRRWLEGYTYRQNGKTYHSDPVIAAHFGRDAGELALSFAQLIELRFVDAFLEYVSWATIKVCARTARDIVGSAYPFSNKAFKTDGKTIIAEIIDRNTGTVQLVDLRKNQFEFTKVVAPLLFAGIDFNQFDEPDRWWPLSKKKGVVVDPKRSFGAPIVVHGGVPTRILAASARAEHSQKRAAQLYDVPLNAVKDAVEFERKFAA